MNFPSSHGINLIIAHRIMHLGSNSCYYNDYLYHSYQNVIIIIIIIIIATYTARKTIKVQILSPKERRCFRTPEYNMMIFTMVNNNHLILLAQ